MFLENSHYIYPKCIGVSYPNSFSIFGNFRNSINFLNDNFWGIVLLILILIFIVNLIFNFTLNRKTLIKYGREYGNNDKKFTTKRCLEDGDKDHRKDVYLINEENKTYQRIEDAYTLNRLGYGGASRTEDCFSAKDYEIKKRIKIYNILTYIKNILKLKDNF